jgi:radical SAM superfamily enzyme YgiQ (UPF0313 family)
MNVILLNSGPRINDFTIYRTLGPYKLAHALREANISTQVIDHVGWLKDETLTQLLDKFVTTDTLCIGISTTFIYQFDAPVFPSPLLRAIERIVQLFPKVKIVLGGPYTQNVRADVALSFTKEIDAIFEEYSEDTFVDYIRSIKESNITLMPPFTHELWNGKGILCFKKPKVERFNIETSAFRFTDDDAIMPNETLPLEVSRGCIFKCKFCNHLLLGRGKLDYLRDFELLKDELMHNYEKWGTTNYYIICDTFNDTEYKMKAWYDMVASLPFKIKYTSYLRADLLDRHPDVPYMLQESGLLAGFHGIESLGEQASGIIGKGWSGKSAREYIPKLYHDIWQKKIAQTLSFIVGLTGDTKESLLDTAHWFVDNDLYNINWSSLGLSNLGSVPGRHASEFEKNATKYGYEFVAWPEDANKANKRYYWKTDYWTLRDADQYVREVLRPTTNPTNARHGSWTLLQFLQYEGVTEEHLTKNGTHTIVKDLNLYSQANLWLKVYVEKLLAL